MSSRFSWARIAGTKVSRYERRVRELNLYAALSYQAVFRTPIDALFPDIYAKVESRVIEPAHELLGELERHDAPSRHIDFKQDFLWTCNSFRGITRSGVAAPEACL
jgi:hypothetical protein